MMFIAKLISGRDKKEQSQVFIMIDIQFEFQNNDVGQGSHCGKLTLVNFCFNDRMHKIVNSLKSCCQYEKLKEGRIIISEWSYNCFHIWL